MEREKELAPVRIALLIDGENVGAKHFPAIAKKVGKLGQPVVRRLFGMSKDWEAVAREKALKVEWQASGGKGKNTVDIAMAVHAMDIVHRGLADAICLVSSDCDFQPLAIHLREAGTTVYGMGEEKTDRSLREAYTEFHVLGNTVAMKPVSVKPTATPVQAKSSPTAARQPSNAPKPDPSPDQNGARLLAVLNKISAQMPISAGLELSPLSKAIRVHDPAFAANFCGNGKFLKNIRATKLFTETGAGASIKVHLKAPANLPV